MENAEEIHILLKILEKIPNLPAYFIADMKERLSYLDDEKYEQMKKYILEAAKKIEKMNKEYLQTLKKIQKEEINPIFKQLEKNTSNTDYTEAEKILLKI